MKHTQNQGEVYIVSDTCNECFGKRKCMRRIRNSHCPSNDGLCCSKFMHPLKPVIGNITEDCNENSQKQEEHPMKTQDTRVTDEVAVVVNRICAGRKGMCLCPIPPGVVACPRCGSKHFKDIVPIDDGSACFIASRELATENPTFKGFGPGHDLKGEHVPYNVENFVGHAVPVT